MANEMTCSSRGVLCPRCSTLDFTSLDALYEGANDWICPECGHTATVNVYVGHTYEAEGDSSSLRDRETREAE